MEAVEGGTLTDLLNGKAMAEVKVNYIVNQIVKTLNYLHGEKKITHRDLKPDNILIEDSSFDRQSYDENKIRIKLTDFGFATFFQEDTSTMNLQIGTARYMAPELLQKGRKKHTEKVDIWALGVITYLMLSGKNIWNV